MNPIDRREAKRQYKEREDIGGIYRIHNTMSGWVGDYTATPNLQGVHSKLQFAKNTGLCFEKALETQWAEFGADAFCIEEVERIKRKPGQTLSDFRKDLATLLELTAGI